jgi:hypothetical protein
MKSLSPSPYGNIVIKESSASVAEISHIVKTFKKSLLSLGMLVAVTDDVK